MENIKEKLDQAIENNEEALVRFLMDLVSHPSTKRHEESAQKFFAGKLQELGAEVELFEPEVAHMNTIPGYASDRDSFSGSPVVGSTIKGSGDGRSLILCGHMDVVEPGDGEWISGSAFTPYYVDGKVYGRGACDMKGGHACSYMAMKAIKDLGIRLKGDVHILASIDEEVGNCGILALLDHGYKADAAIVTEPTAERLTVSTAGAIWFKLHIYGKSAHGGSAYFGQNAIYKAIPFLNRIREWEEERRLRLFGKVKFYEDLQIPFCIGVNMFHAGDMPAIVPEEAVLQGRIGISPLETTEEVMNEFEEMIKGVAQGDPFTKENPPLVEYIPSRWVSHYLDEDSPLVELLGANYQATTGKAAVLNGFKAASDSGTIHRIGGIPAIDFGPGPDTVLHKTNEYIEVESLINVTKTLAKTIVDWCGVEGG